MRTQIFKALGQHGFWRDACPAKAQRATLHTVIAVKTRGFYAHGVDRNNTSQDRADHPS